MTEKSRKAAEKSVRPGSRAIARWGCIAGLVLTGCSLSVDPKTVQCESHRECVALTGEGVETRCENGYCKLVSETERHWGCLGSPPWTQIAGLVTYQAKLLDPLTGLPAEGLEVRVCSDLDLPCATPLKGPLKPEVPGRLSLDLDRGFDGYIEIRSAEFAPTLIDFASPLLDDQMLSMDEWTLARPTQLADTARAVGALAREDRGQLVGSVNDCLDQPASGFSVRADPADEATATFVFVNRTPTAQVGATQASGMFGVTGAKPGYLAVSATSASGTTFPVRTAVIRSGAVTYTNLLPH